MKKLLFFLLTAISTVYVKAQTFDTLTVDLPGKVVNKHLIIDCPSNATFNTSLSSQSVLNNGFATNAALTTLQNLEKQDVADLKAKDVQLAASIAAIPTGNGTYTPSAVKKISGSTYTVTQADLLTTLEFTGSSCTVYFSGLTNGFECNFIRAVGEVTFFKASNLKVPLSKYRMQTQYCQVRCKYDGTYIFLTGELKQ